MNVVGGSGCCKWKGGIELGDGVYVGCRLTVGGKIIPGKTKMFGYHAWHCQKARSKS